MTRILRGLTSQRLACGCTAGVYETYDGRVVSVLDARGERCRDETHEAGRLMPDTATNQAHRPPVQPIAHT
jgi:hypothetical protein